MNVLAAVISNANQWQTLLTGVLAVGAAYWAARPVYKQIKLMQAQNNVMVRSTIGEMVLQLDENRDRADAILVKRLSEITASIYRFENYGERRGIEEWASQQQSEFNHAETDLKALFVLSHDVEDIEEKKAVLLNSIRSLTGVLWDIYAPDYAMNFPEEFDWTDEQRSAANARSIEAENELSEKVSTVSRTLHQLKEAYATQRAVLVRRLRIIDDSLLA